jgi:hypothetical protein
VWGEPQPSEGAFGEERRWLADDRFDPASGASFDGADHRPGIGELAVGAWPGGVEVGRHKARPAAQRLKGSVELVEVEGEVGAGDDDSDLLRVLADSEVGSELLDERTFADGKDRRLGCVLPQIAREDEWDMDDLVGRRGDPLAAEAGGEIGGVLERVEAKRSG